jgi:hypothetical protein
MPYKKTKMDTVESLTILLWSNDIYACAVCRGSSGFPSDKTEFLNERFLVSALVKAKRFGETQRTPSNLEPGIFRESRMVSRAHFLTELDLHLVDLTFVPKVHNGVQMGLLWYFHC